MYLLQWDSTQIALILLAVVLIVYAVVALLKKAKRAVRRWHFASLFSGKALLIGTLLFGGEDEVQAFLQYTPYSFQQTILSSDFEFDYKDNRLLFAKDDTLSGSIQLDNQHVKVFIGPNQRPSEFADLLSGGDFIDSKCTGNFANQGAGE